MGKKFKEGDNTAVFTTKFVIEDKKDITTVFHFEDDGAWQFSSDDLVEDFEEVARIVGVGEMISIDESVLEIADLPEGYCAQRKSKNDTWQIGLIPSD